MRVLGIDPGLANTGWGIIQNSVPNEDWEVIDFGSVTTKARSSTAERLNKIYTEISGLIRKHSPDVVAVEKIFLGVNAKSALKVGEARGAVILAAGDAKLEVREYTATEIKVALTDYGQASKEQVQLMVKRFLNLPKIPKPDHAADALACAYCYAVSNGDLKL
ncbi:MAG: crossover junction endodeoxyribonuclease RuvC [Patescibacteria group bacterium]|nr:crossover junction endodeoxyribonuclease RuvC [Patescibacteria group bacterium]